MIPAKDLKKLARGRLKDAEVLCKGRRYDGAVYLCGYAIELALKARVCKTLKWSGFPETRKEFNRLGSFRTHNLEVLLHLSGIEARVKANRMADWSVFAQWGPELRYRQIGTANSVDARDMIDAAKNLLRVL